MTFAARARRVSAETATLSRTVPACAERASSDPRADEMLRPDERGAERSRASGNAFVGDEDGARAGRPGVLRLLQREAGAAAHERNGATREAREVRRLAAARGRGGLDGHDLRRRSPAAGVTVRQEIGPLLIALRARRDELEAGRPSLAKQVVRERLEPRSVAGRAEPADHVGDRLVVTARADRATSPVAPRDRGQCEEMRPQLLRRHCTREGFGADRRGPRL
jgi:hypothetical protein